MNMTGYRNGDPHLPESPVSMPHWERMQEAALFGADDVAALRRSKAILEPRVNDILDVWYGFVGSKPFLLDQFTDRSTHQPDADYLAKVRVRFCQWILDTAEAQYDETWLRWQVEIGRRHHRVGKNKTDGANATALVPFSYLVPLAQPIVQTLRPFLEGTGEPSSVVDAMQDAWRKSVLLQVTLWSFPYIVEGDF